MEKVETPRLLIVGGTGFIGYHALVAAKKKGWSVTSISLNPPLSYRRVDGIRYLNLDLSDTKETGRLLQNKEFEYVVNLGGYIDHKLFKDGGRKIIDTHFNGLQSLLSVLTRDTLRRFVQVGSSDEYGDAIAPQVETLREQPISPYSLAKVSSTQFIQMLQGTEEFPGVILRLYLTYGPGQDNNRFLPQVIRGCLNNLSFPVSFGAQLRDFCYIGDTVEAIFRALRRPGIDGEIINIASGQSVSIRTVIENVRSQIGGGHPQFGQVPYRPGENMALYASVTKAKQLLDWQSSVSLNTGLAETISWYKQYL